MAKKQTDKEKLAEARAQLRKLRKVVTSKTRYATELWEERRDVLAMFSHRASRRAAIGISHDQPHPQPKSEFGRRILAMLDERNMAAATAASRVEELQRALVLERARADRLEEECATLRPFTRLRLQEIVGTLEGMVKAAKELGPTPAQINLLETVEELREENSRLRSSAGIDDEDWEDD